MTRSRYKSPQAVAFGLALHRLRTQRGWTLTKLARRCGMNATYLGRLEKGVNTPSLESLFELAEILGVQPSEIVREMDDRIKEMKAFMLRKDEILREIDARKKS